jgi:hypothetical protein
MELSYPLELDTIERQLFNEWFNTKCDLIAWDGEDSKERLWGTKQGWMASDSLVIEEPC